MSETKTFYAKPIKSFDNFKRGNLYIIHATKADYFYLLDDRKRYIWTPQSYFKTVEDIFDGEDTAEINSKASKST